MSNNTLALRFANSEACIQLTKIAFSTDRDRDFVEKMMRAYADIRIEEYLQEEAKGVRA